MATLGEKLEAIRTSLSWFAPELMLTLGIVVILIAGLISKKNPAVFSVLCALVLTACVIKIAIQWPAYSGTVSLFGGMLRSDGFSAYLRILIDIGGLLTVLMSWRNQQKNTFLSEYYALVLAVVLGAHTLVMSQNLVVVFISLELISICSYVLAGSAVSRQGAEGSLKYFLFGSVASAAMLYGFTFLYGITGSMAFSSPEFVHQLSTHQSSLLWVASLLVLAGFFFKMAVAPFHPWAPDVYEAAPMPVVAFFAVVPKLAGLGVLTRFIVSTYAPGVHSIDWQVAISAAAILSLTVGNFSALWQKNAKRLMGYSSIAQSGFLLVGIAALLPFGIHVMLFYVAVYLLGSFAVFIFLQGFESAGVDSITGFEGIGKKAVWPMVALLAAFISLTGLPPTAGFTAKLFIFSALWEAYQLSGKSILLVLLIFGLVNTVVSLFYYLRIPYYAFVRKGESPLKPNIITFENLFGLILVVVILILFFGPGLLMGWINKINFAL